MKKVIFISFDLVYPFFCGAVASALVCFFVIFPRVMSKMEASFRHPAAGSYPVSGEALKGDPLPASLAQDFSPIAVTISLAPASHDREGPILAAYRDSGRQDRVTALFSGVLRSAGGAGNTGELAAAILSNASAFNIAPGLAFALCWAESRFNPRAVNSKNRDASIDRGLFQLNSNSFPNLKEADYFNPSVNAYYGMAHLRWCLDSGGSVAAGLAMYNAGIGRVRSGGTPKTTLDYISHIMESQQRIEEAYASYLVLFLEESPPVVEVGYEGSFSGKPQHDKPRLALLTPIAGRP
jgi:hypothetical protein